MRYLTAIHPTRGIIKLRIISKMVILLWGQWWLQGWQLRGWWWWWWGWHGTSCVSVSHRWGGRRRRGSATEWTGNIAGEIFGGNISRIYWEEIFGGYIVRKYSKEILTEYIERKYLEKILRNIVRKEMVGLYRLMSRNYWEEKWHPRIIS